MPDTALSEQEVRDRYRRLQTKVREYRQEALRCRKIASMLANARGTKAVLAGVYPDPNNAGGMLAWLCAPNLDEARAALESIARKGYDPSGWCQEMARRALAPSPQSPSGPGSADGGGT
ncbi:MAG: hypothetical protein ABI445_24200 [Polyangia bacterium]